MRSIMRATLSLLLLVGAGATAAAQDTAYQRWLADQNKKFQAYQDEQDKAFAKFLDKQWHRELDQRDTNHFLGPERPVAPVAPPVPAIKPAAPPTVIARKTTAPLPSINLVPPKITPRTPPPSGGGAPGDSSSVSLAGAGAGNDAGMSRASLSFFGAPVALRYLPLTVSPIAGDVTPKAIAAFWDEISKAPFDVLLEQAQGTRAKYGFGDWPYTQLLGRMAGTLFPDDTRRTLFVWFMLQKSGYRAKVGYSGDKVVLLMSAATQLYEVSYFTDADGQRYYGVSLDGIPRKTGPIYTYDGDYPGATRKIDYRFAEPPHFEGAAGLIERTMSFQFKGQKYQVTTHVERALADHLYRYPRLDFPAYFDGAMSSRARAELLPQLKTIIAGMSELESTELLLHFVQTAFEYKTAANQFGFDKPYFPDEMFVYPYSDCKDRAVLFAYLVRSLLDLKVIGLLFPNHLSTAVHFNTAVTGRTVRYDGVDYVMSDPTYIGAPVGLEMPQYDKNEPDVVLIGRKP